MGEAADQPGPNGIDSGRNDDRGGRGHLLDRNGCGSRVHYDQIGFKPNHLGRKFVESFCAALRIPALNDDVVSLHVTKLPELVEQHVIMFKPFVCDEANPPHLARLLPARRERPCSRRATEQRDEVASFQLRDHSITSSAATWIVSGTFRPSTFAVLRLRTSSNLVG